MSRKSALLTVILLLPAVGIRLHAQDRRHREWWSEKYRVVPSGESGKADRAAEIFSRLKPLAETKAERDPKLLIIDGDGETTVVAIEDGTIVLPLDAIDICYRGRPRGDGDDLLAFVLGHELSHLASDEFRHLEAFQARERHVRDPQAREGLDDSDPRREAVKTESEADDRGLVLMTMAGFRPATVAAAGSEFFESWLRSIPYGFSQDGAYPTPAERAAYVQANLQETIEKLEYFELGVRFYEMGAYPEAIALYEVFARQIHDRAVLNNLGLSHLQWAMDLLGDCDSSLVLRFKLPIQLDPHSLAKAARRGSPSDCYRAPSFVKHKAQANEYFERAIRGNPGYYPAYLNLISLLILSNDGAGALSNAQKALELRPGDPELESLSAIAIHLYDQQDRYLDTDNAGLKKIRAVAEKDPASATVAYNRARLESEVFGSAAANGFWRKYLELESDGPHARLAREQSGLVGDPQEGAAAVESPPPAFPVPLEGTEKWLEKIDGAPLRIDAGRLQGRLYAGAALRAFVVDSEVVLAESRIEEPLTKAQILERYGPPRGTMDTTQGEFLDYRRFGFDMVAGAARKLVFFRWPGGSRR